MVPLFAMKILPVKQSCALTYDMHEKYLAATQYTTSVSNMSIKSSTQAWYFAETAVITDIFNNQLEVYAWICARGIDADFFVVYLHI
jgi:hypothetical protein